MASTTSTATDLRGALERVVGAEHVRDDAGALLTFSTDATPLERGRPDVVVFPATTDEVAGVIRLANERCVPVIPRGSGTNLSAGTVPHRGGIVLVLTRMNRLIEVDPGDLVAVCEPGVRTIELAQAAAAEGLLFPPDPGSHTTATIGGNVAECSGGLRALKYGVTRDYVLGVEAVLGSGEVIRSGGRLVKDVAGYDLRRLLCGSEGTLAVMTELTLRLMPAPEATGTGMAYFDDLAAAARAVSRVLAEGVLPVTLEFLDRVCIDAVEGYANIGLDRSAGALLIFGQDGDRASIDRDMRRMADACEAEGATSVRIAASEEEAADVLQARRAVLPALSRLEPLTILEDATAPRSRWTGRSRASTASASSSCATSSASSGQSTSRSCGGSRPPSTRTASSTRASSARDPRDERARLAGAPARHLHPGAARPLHLVRLLPARLPDLRAHARGDVLAARADQPHARDRDRRPRRGRPDRRRGVLVLPRLPRVRARVPGRRPVRRAARGVARPRVARPAPPAEAAGAAVGGGPALARAAHGPAAPPC